LVHAAPKTIKKVVYNNLDAFNIHWTRLKRSDFIANLSLSRHKYVKNSRYY